MPSPMESRAICLAVAGACAVQVEAASYRMLVKTVPQAGDKCVSAPNGPFVEGMRVFLWDCNADLAQTLDYDALPAHGSLKPQDQHVIIFTPAFGYKGQDSFTLSMREHNGGRTATLSVNVSVTIK